jgi:hypothetical protein
LLLRSWGKIRPNEAILSLAHLGCIADNPKESATGVVRQREGLGVLKSTGTLSNGALATIILYCMFPDEKRRSVEFKDLSKSDGLLAHS